MQKHGEPTYLARTLNIENKHCELHSSVTMPMELLLQNLQKATMTWNWDSRTTVE